RHFAVEALDDRTRQSLRSGKADQDQDLIVDPGLGDGRDFRLRRIPLARRYGDRAKFSGPRVRQRAWQWDEKDAALTGDQVGERGAAALVGNVMHLDSGPGREEFRGKVRWGAGP